MNTVWKFSLDLVDGPQRIEMPSEASALTLRINPDESGRKIDLWARVDSDVKPVARFFIVTGTGHKLPPTAGYIGTAHDSLRRLVWHVWELP